MGDLSDFERGQMVGVGLAGASVTKTPTLFGVWRATVSKVISAYMNHGKTTSMKRNSGRKSTLTERDCRTLRTVSKNQSTAAQVTAELNIHLQDPVFTKTVQHELHKSNIDGRAAIPKPLITESNAQMCKRWCHDHKTWTSDNWKRMIWSDESSSTLFPTSGRVYIWRTHTEAHNPECLVPTVKHGGSSVMVWAGISW
jgi:transposase